MTIPTPTDSADFAPVPVMVVAGLGLLGGGIALAARERGLADRIVALGRNLADLEAARDAGVVDEVHTDPARALARAHWVVLCQPVDVIVEELPKFLATAPAGAIVTDVGSTKGAIVERAEAVSGEGAWFVGSHPMAGSDKTGWRNGRAGLFEKASCYVTLTGRTNLDAVARVGAFWRALGSRVFYSSPARHDRIVALLSHVPHLAAVALMEQLVRSGEDPQILKVLAGPGLRDTTRVAKGSPDLWEHICRQNAGPVADLLDNVGGRFHELARLLRDDDEEGLRQVLTRAADLRKGLD